jgi:chromosome segregation ATPase
MAGLLEEWEERVTRLENELAEARNRLATIRADIEHCISVINTPDQVRSVVDAAGLRLSQYLGSEL